jgi:hypothetical protein
MDQKSDFHVFQAQKGMFIPLTPGTMLNSDDVVKNEWKCHYCRCNNVDYKLVGPSDFSMICRDCVRSCKNFVVIKHNQEVLDFLKSIHQIS